MMTGIGLSIAQQRRAGAPTLLPQTNLLARWYGTDVYTDTAVTAPATVGQNVMGMKDQTGAGLHAVRASADGTRPVAQSGYLAFNGTVQQMQLPAGINTSRQDSTLVFIGRLNDLSTTRSLMDAGPGQLALFTGQGHINAYKGSGYQPTGIIPRTDVPCVFVISSGGSRVRVYVNGVMHTAALIATAATAAGGSLGKVSASGGYFRDQFYEAAVYAGELSEALIRQIGAYAAARWGAVLKIPTHTLIFKGDSRTSAAIALTHLESFPGWVVHNAPHQNLRLYNLGVASQAVSAMKTNYPTEVAPLYDASLGADKNILVIQGGGNDVIAGTTPAQLLQLFKDIAILAHTTGYKVVVGSMLPRTDTVAAAASYNTLRNAFNVLLAGDHAWAEGYVPVGEDVTIGPDATPDSTTYYHTDKAHLNDAGQAVAAAVYSPVVNGFL